MVAVTGEADRLMALNDGMLSVPLTGRLMEGRELFQVYMVPVTVPAKVIGSVGLPLQTTWPNTGFTSGIGLTITVFVVVPAAVHPVAGSV